jgi:hypothetical protein
MAAAGTAMQAWFPRGVFATLAVCFSVFAAVGVALFRRGRWKLTRV